MSKLILTRRDEEIIAAARYNRALCPLDGHRVRDEAGSVLVPCGDGDQFHWVFQNHCQKLDSTRHHLLSLNGGALLISPHSPVPDAGIDGAVLLRHIRGAMRLKGMNMVIPCGHAPCGIAYENSLGALEVFRLMIEAKLCIRRNVGPGKKVRIFFQVDRPGADRDTYFVDRKAMVNFLQKNGRAIRLE